MIRAIWNWFRSDPGPATQCAPAEPCPHGSTYGPCKICPPWRLVAPDPPRVEIKADASQFTEATRRVDEQLRVLGTFDSNKLHATPQPGVYWFKHDEGHSLWQAVEIFEMERGGLLLCSTAGDRGVSGADLEARWRTGRFVRIEEPKS